MASPARAAIRGLRPGPALVGTARVPGSKSIAQRALMAASLAVGTTRFGTLPPGEDVLAAAALAARLAQIGPRAGARTVLHAGESGTLARLALAVLGLGAGGPGPFRLEVAGTLRRRRSAPLLAALRAAGARIEEAGARGDGAGWPLAIEPPASAPRSLRLVDPVSSQEASGLCLALAALGGERVLEIEGRLPSRPYLDLTLGVLGDFGARCAARGLDGAAGEVRVRGPLTAPAAPLEFEPDASLAAVVLAAGIASGGRVEVAGIPERSLQGDARAVEHLRALGFAAGRAGGRLFAGDGRPPGPGPGPAVALDLEGTPDLAPVLVALVAAARPGRATFLGLETLERKESPRLTGLARGLLALGLEVETEPGRLTLVRPARLATEPLELDCDGDHRMAFAWSLVGLARERLSLRGTDCVAKSWPGFFAELERLGARVAR